MTNQKKYLCEVSYYLSFGFTNKEISKLCGCCTGTVEIHICNIFNKTLRDLYGNKCNNPSPNFKMHSFEEMDYGKQPMKKYNNSFQGEEKVIYDKIVNGEITDCKL